MICEVASTSGGEFLLSNGMLSTPASAFVIT